MVGQDGSKSSPLYGKQELHWAISLARSGLWTNCPLFRFFRVSRVLTMEEYRFWSYLSPLMGYGGPRWFKIIAFIRQTRTTLGNFTCKEWMVDEFPFVPFFQGQSRAYHGGVSFSVVSFAPNGLWWAKMVQNHRLYKTHKNFIRGICTNTWVWVELSG